jgi:TrmH family RNA methyltransferase
MITSKSNELIKKCIQIKQKKYSRDWSLCLIESIKIVRELSEKSLIDVILVIQEKYELVKGLSANKIELISNDIAKHLSDASTTDGVFAICNIPSCGDLKFDRCLILDRIQDPTNMGAIIRSACAFGYRTILTINSVYPYSFKTIRSSMGNVFNVNLLEVDLEMLKKIKIENNICFYIADMDGECIDNIKVGSENLALIIGNEGQGVDDNLLKLSDKVVSIPMQSNVESLNASVSAGILMYLLK